jgi:uncharacterized membrane protein YjjP (DUF1212 family)
MTDDPVRLKHRQLEKIAMTALRMARVLVECGARVRVVHQGASLVARGLGVEPIGLRTGYASQEITVRSGDNTITRMMTIGPHGVNHRLDHAMRALAVRVSQGGMGADEADAEMDRLTRETSRHPLWLVALAVGLACAAFGRLLGIDWAAFTPVLLGGGLGQAWRMILLRRGINAYVVAAAIAFAAAAIACEGARLAGSSTLNLAMMAAILLLVPGVPATNAQTDIMDGYPSMGSARAVSVIMVMIFATCGVWLAQAMLGVVLPDITAAPPADAAHLLHQAAFGAAAAAGFGVLFNFGLRSLLWCAAAGALALGVRTAGLDLNWSLEAASFVAAVTVCCAANLLRGPLAARGNAVALAGCIPMVPGAFLSQAILGMLAVTTPHPENAVLILTAIEYLLRVFFTLAAIGAGLAIPAHLLKNADF